MQLFTTGITSFTPPPLSPPPPPSHAIPAKRGSFCTSTRSKESTRARKDTGSKGPENTASPPPFIAHWDWQRSSNGEPHNNDNRQTVR